MTVHTNITNIMKSHQNQYFPQTMSCPGETLEEKLREMSITMKEFSDLTDISEDQIIGIVNGKVKITKSIAVKFEKVTKIPAHFWINSQHKYNEFITKQRCLNR